VGSNPPSASTSFVPSFQSDSKNFRLQSAWPWRKGFTSKTGERLRGPLIRRAVPVAISECIAFGKSARRGNEQAPFLESDSLRTWKNYHPRKTWNPP